MHFGPELKQWIRIIYTYIFSACLHSGFVTSFFEIIRVARQGGPLSSLLHTLVAEVLEIVETVAIRNCTDIQGLRLPGTSEEFKISQYADDGNLTSVDVFPLQRLLKSFAYLKKVQGPSWI